MNVKDAMSSEHKDMMFYEDRLVTFEHWSKQIHPDKYRLAKAGFYYTGEIDKVACFACSVILSEWERTDDPWVEHFKWSKNCSFLKMMGNDATIDIPSKGSTGFHFQSKQNESFNNTNAGFRPTSSAHVPTTYARPLNSSLFVKRF